MYDASKDACFLGQICLQEGRFIFQECLTMRSIETTAAKLSVFKMTWPIFIEILLQMMVGNVDQFMLSHYSQNPLLPLVTPIKSSTSLLLPSA